MSRKVLRMERTERDSFSVYTHVAKDLNSINCESLSSVKTIKPFSGKKDDNSQV